jgi:signal peptidase II
LPGNICIGKRVPMRMNLRWLRPALLAAAVFLVGCDHVTKHVARMELEHRPPHGLATGILELDYTENTDSGFGLLRWVAPAIRTPLLTAAQLVGGLAFLLVCLRRRLSAPARFALLLLAAGAFGNGLDRLAHGHVVDFIHLTHWPVFNVADIYITVGAVLLILATRNRNNQDRLSPAI